MKKVFLFLTLLLGFLFSYGQNDCAQGDGTFRYEAKLNIVNVPTDFDKDDFIIHITGLDNISIEDLTILIDNITLVYKTFPSQNPHRTATVVTTTEIDSILAELINSIEFHYCVVNDCTQSNGTLSYYALLTSNNIPNDFDKADFINFIIGLDEITNEDLATLIEHITSVYKAFPTAQSTFLQRVVVIDATTEIYPILADLSNSIEYHSCNGDGVILEINENKKFKKSIVCPNPITEDSVIELNLNSTAVRIELINGLGQIIQNEEFKGKSTIELKFLPIVRGIYYLKIYDLTNGNIETLKIVKE